MYGDDLLTQCEYMINFIDIYYHNREFSCMPCTGFFFYDVLPFRPAIKTCFMVKFKHERKTVRLKTFIKNFNVLNTILLLITGLFIFYIFLPGHAIHIKYQLPTIKPPQEKAEEGIQSGNRTPSITEYAIVSEKNLFNPERKIPVVKTAEEQQSLPKPEFLLYGTLISHDVKLAYIEDLKALRNTPGRGRRQVALKIGDVLSGFTLKEIYPDYIVMTRGEETVTVKITDNAEKKIRTFQATPQPQSVQPPHPVSPRRARGIPSMRPR
jgi:hypothetical protein